MLSSEVELSSVLPKSWLKGTIYQSSVSELLNLWYSLPHQLITSRAALQTSVHSKWRLWGARALHIFELSDRGGLPCVIPLTVATVEH